MPVEFNRFSRASIQIQLTVLTLQLREVATRLPQDRLGDGPHLIVQIIPMVHEAHSRLDRLCSPSRRGEIPTTVLRETLWTPPLPDR